MALALRREVTGRPMRSPQVPEDPKPRRHRPDYLIVVFMVLLLSIGLTVVYAISPALGAGKDVGENYFVIHQLIAILLGAAIFVFTSRFPYSHLRTMYIALLVAAGVATLIALALPVDPQYPAHRWIRFGGFSFQSVELLKFAILIWFAGFLALRIRDGSIGDTNKTLKPILIAIGAIGIVVAGIQSDLGSTGVIVLMMGAMAFIAGLPMKRIFLIAAIIIALVFVAVISTPYRRDRLLTFMNPTSNCLTTGYQACQALIAVGSGGPTGLGLGRSVQAYGYLPEAENDSIFAIYAEKFGFVGVTALIAIFIALFTRIKRVAERAPDNFSRLVVVGILVWLSAQAMINIGAMLGLLPLKGITLPFISYGGSSVLFVMAALGLVFQISHYTQFTDQSSGGSYDHRRNGRGVRGAYHPAAGRRS